MVFRRSDLQEAFFVPGTQAFRVYGYGTTDRLEQVLAPDYFAPARGLLRPGELIYVSTAAPPARPGEPGEVRLALVMARSDERAPDRSDGSVRPWLLGPTTNVDPEQRGSRTSAARAIRPRVTPWRLQRG